MIEHLNEDLQQALPDDARSNAERENGCAAYTIIAIRETYNKFNKPRM